MNIAVVQFAPKFGNKENNIEKLQHYIYNTKASIIVFPELALSGYFFLSRQEVQDVAEDFNGEVIQSFQDMATKLDKTIVFGFAEKDSGKLYNSAAVLLPEKELSRAYRKTHLFYKERYCFDEGDTGFFVINDRKRNINIGTMICYDWRFPESARSLGLLGADLIVCPSNLVTNSWHIVMPARALENKLYLAVANRTGTEEREGEVLLFRGESAFWSYNGQLMSKAGLDDETVLYADIEPEKTRDKSFNHINDIFRDRRPEMYE